MAEDDGGDGSAIRAKSTIKFPYSGLSEAIKVAEALHNKHGGSCTPDQLAASLGHVAESGTFRMKLYATATFGLLRVSRGRVEMLPLGDAIINPVTSARAKVDAFLTVPLYRRVYDNFRGRLLPKDEGLEHFLVSAGVSRKQADKARRALQGSAETAGMFASGKDRLVIPSGLDAVTPPEDEEVPEDQEQGEQGPRDGDEKGGGHGKARTGGGEGDDFALPAAAKHHLIYGLLAELPVPGEAFPADERQTWLEMAKLAFTMIYGKVDRPSLPVPRGPDA